MTNDHQHIYVTTTGRRTGNPHTIEIWYVAHDGCYYIVSEKRERSHWVLNIQANPAVSFRVGDRSAPLIEGTARTVDPAAEPELAAAVSALMDAKYDWSDGLIVELKANG